MDLPHSNGPPYAQVSDEVLRTRAPKRALHWASRRCWCWYAPDPLSLQPKSHQAKRYDTIACVTCHTPNQDSAIVQDLVRTHHRSPI